MLLLQIFMAAFAVRNSGGAGCPCPVLLCFFINHEHSPWALCPRRPTAGTAMCGCTKYEPSRSRKATPPRRARPLPGRPARSNGRRSREPRMGAIRPLPMKARAALILPRLRPSSNPSIRPRSRRRKMGRNCPHHNIPRLPFFRRALSLPLYRAYGRARA